MITAYLGRASTSGEGDGICSELGHIGAKEPTLPAADQISGSAGGFCTRSPSVPVERLLLQGTLGKPQ